MSNSTSQFIIINGTKIHYKTNGVKTQKNILLIHGSGGDTTHWPEEIYRDIPDTGIFTVDLPGHGQSEGSGLDSIDGYADFIDVFVKNLSLEGVFAAGHSLGGAVVLTLGLRNPAWLSGLILVGTGGRLRVTDAILDGIMSDKEGTIDIITDYAWGPSASSELKEAYKTGLSATPAGTTLGDFSACNRFDVMDRIGQIRLSSLIISGTADRLTPEKYGAFLHNVVPGSVFKTIENAGHMMALEKPEQFIQIVKEFLISR